MPTALRTAFALAFVGVFGGLALGAYATWLTLSEVVTIGTYCGNVIDAVFPADSIEACRAAMSRRTLFALVATIAALAVTSAGIASAVWGMRAEAKLVTAD